MLRGELLTVFANCEGELFDRREATHDVYCERNIQQQIIDIFSSQSGDYNKDWNVGQRRHSLLQQCLYTAARYIQERPLSTRQFRLPVRLPPAISLSTA